MIDGRDLLYVTNKEGTRVCVGYKKRENEDVQQYLRRGIKPFSSIEPCKVPLPSEYSSKKYVWYGEEIRQTRAAIKQILDECSRRKGTTYPQKGIK